VFEPLGQATLATGERMELARVVGPDGAWAPRLGALLGHKPGVYRYHIEASLREPLGDLETAFYLGLVDGDPIAGGGAGRRGPCMSCWPRTWRAAATNS
jgi:hypothetical protein